MGMAYSSLMKILAFSKKNVRILMVGLDAAGKTTILYKLKLGEVGSTIPTIGFNVETVNYKNLCLTVWDVGGQQRIRHLWHHYFTNTAAVIFVVDSADINRLDEAAEELQVMMQRHELQNAVLLVYANKQDLPNALTITKMVTQLKLHELKQPWHLHPVCATKGVGLWDGIDHLSQMLTKQKIQKP